MRTEELAELLTSLHQVAEVVEAIDHPEIQARRGWDLGGWSYDCIPWGVRLVHYDRDRRVMDAIVAVALPSGERNALPPTYLHGPWPTKLLLLG